MNASNSFKSEFPPINSNNLSSLTSECLVTDEETYKQLIILGNGFDLACGLKSSYLAFFEYIFQKRLPILTIGIISSSLYLIGITK
ncbi:bacteriophage abortive infection AbiH family protein [Streptococcus agalactiae]|nr:bacteriophage abortive infection AbiH family protein [Streptococcus agalactiae]